MDKLKLNQEIIDWMKCRPLLNINGLTRCAELPKSKLKEVIAGRQKLKVSQIEKLMPHLQRYGFKFWQHLSDECYPHSHERAMMRFKDRYGSERWEIGFHRQNRMIPRQGEIEVIWCKV